MTSEPAIREQRDNATRIRLTAGRALMLPRRRFKPVIASALRRSRHPAWASRTAARYSLLAVATGDAAIVLRREHAAGASFIDARSRHLHLAQRWAPRLQLTVLAMPPQSAGALEEGKENAAAGSPPLPRWQLTRDVASVHERQELTHLRYVRTALEALSVDIRTRILARDGGGQLEALPSSAHAAQFSRGWADASGPALAPIELAPRLPAAPLPQREPEPVSRVFPRPQPAPPAAAPSAAGARAYEDEVLAPPRLRPALPPDSDPIAIERISERVMQQISHRIQSHRERTGRA